MTLREEIEKIVNQYRIQFSNGRSMAMILDSSKDLQTITPYEELTTAILQAVEKVVPSDEELFDVIANLYTAIDKARACRSTMLKKIRGEG